LGGGLAFGAVDVKPEVKPPEKSAPLWILTPLSKPEPPTGVTPSKNPIDAFVADQYRAKGLKPVPTADKATLLRRVYMDLIGIPPRSRSRMRL